MGGQEVPPAATLAQGQAVFQLSKDGTMLHYTLIASNIENILQSHIHLAPAGVNGPVVVWLYPSSPPAVLIPGRFSGVLAEGTITADDLVGPLAGQPLSSLIDEITAGNAYVNVHTSQYPGGEIRGQIR
ncbi:CHRD domain protein [Candidatus Bathyarchaeota archaeon RBG_16_57_9]|nr:MAG: CHRD domain protein [Candidatus Bathyarchaeota archaeon RBG_16_57_9]